MPKASNYCVENHTLIYLSSFTQLDIRFIELTKYTVLYLISIRQINLWNICSPKRLHTYPHGA